MRPINEKDQHLIDSIPKECNEILEVGAGDCVLDYYLANMGFDVTATDIYTDEMISTYDKDLFEFYEASIFNLDTFPKKEYEVVICSQVLEYISDFETAFKNLLTLTSNTLIVTIPWRKSFLDTGHVNFWDDVENKQFKSINVFKKLAKDYNIFIEKIYTKEQDRQTNSMNYLIKVTK